MKLKFLYKINALNFNKIFFSQYEKNRENRKEKKTKIQ